MTAALPAVVLRVLTPILVQGEDARKFLQGQLTNDVRQLRPDQALLAALTTGQGRVQTLLTLVERPEGIFALLPPQAVDLVLERFRRMTLRAKVSFHPDTSWAVASISARGARELFDAVPDVTGACVHHAAATALRWWSSDERIVVLSNRDLLSLCDPDTDALDLQWRGADVAAGLPSIHPQTRESFVPQALNLDLLGAVSFDKGCYVGQEVVARARRAPARRRMYRFHSGGAPPNPGAPVRGLGTIVGEVVEAVPSDSGAELLAVVDVAHADAALALESGEPLQLLSLPQWLQPARED